MYHGSWSLFAGFCLIFTLFLAPYPDAHPRRFLAKELHSQLTARDLLVKEERKANPELSPHTHRKWWRTPISTLLQRSNTFHGESDDEADLNRSSKKQKNQRVEPHMIRRIDENPKPINPSGWISQGRVPVPQADLVEPESIRSKSSIIDQPTNSTLVESPEPTNPQPSGQQLNDSDAESGSGLEDLSEIPHPGKRNRHVTGLGAFQHRKFALYGHASSSFTSPTVTPPSNHPPLHPSRSRGSVTRTQTVEFAPTPQLRARPQKKTIVDESRTQPGVSIGDSHVEVASESLSYRCTKNVANLLNRISDLHSAWDKSSTSPASTGYATRLGRVSHAA